MRKIAPSILSADFTKLGDEIIAVEKAGADIIHIDVMDGHFVPNITMGPLIVQAVRKMTQLPLDVHLMIQNPDQYIDDFAKAGADMISIHVEACLHLNRSLHRIIENKVMPGVAINPATPFEAVRWVLPQMKYLVIMSVNPGFGGQGFIPNTLEKICLAKKYFHENQNKIAIQVDGGVSKDTVGKIAEAGCDIFVAGSAIYGTNDYAIAINQLHNNS
ncbi:MAG: Ribulose-phosphate 3-epimerase [Candidatus Magnetoglobus multicellularis str. Araruama]|uniref:Ribulose-phosphate 3-epimerase n=1 Tax=Candidatus Magnetoglobus multicellularis str. Araruama TaxID=890399 RepID=A0A1V1PI29_9BACT|nr:MAG: Ribulose-phosphate 3-epimerase [Candidatus Magnetoglobus multicellularis str. Araruama]